MPFKSQKQREYFYWAECEYEDEYEDEGLLSSGTAKKWEKKTRGRKPPRKVGGGKRSKRRERSNARGH